MTQQTERPAPREAEREAPHDVVRELHHDIAHSLEQRVAPPGTWRARAEEVTKRRGARLWGALEKRPSLGTLVVGGLVIAAADAVGVGELAMGIAAGYAAWRVLRKGKPAGEASEETGQIEGSETTKDARPPAG